jgi:hypothetical protein
MPQTPDRQAQLRRIRDFAQRARRLALSVSEADRGRLLKHAEELEQQARELEQETAGPAAQMQVQQQQQQQETAPPAADPDDGEPKT